MCCALYFWLQRHRAPGESLFCPAHPQVAFPGVPQGCRRGWSVRREGSQSPSPLLTALKNPGSVSFRHLKAVMGFFPQNRNKRISLIAESPPD